MPVSKDKPLAVKLTEKQWEVLERMERGEQLCGDDGAWSMFRNRPSRGDICTGHVADAVVNTLENKNAIEWQPCTAEHDRRWIVTPAGRAALAARRAEKDKVANG
jgi:hypothetical protein